MSAVVGKAMCGLLVGDRWFLKWLDPPTTGDPVTL
jgi:hypothetical protein